MKNRQQLNLFLRQAQCLALAVIMLVAVAATFAQNKDPQKEAQNPPQDTQQKTPPPDLKVDVKQLPVAGP